MFKRPAQLQNIVGSPAKTNARPMVPYKPEKLAKLIPKKSEDLEMPIVEDGEVIELKPKDGLGMFDKMKLKRQPQSTFLVTMKFSNGTRRTWVINTKNELFTYKKKTYYLYYQNAYYDLTHHQYHIEFFDDFAVPIDREIVQKEDETEGLTAEMARAYFSVTPSNLKSIIKMEYVKALAQSQEINKYLKLIMVFVLVALFLLLYHTYKFYKITGGI